MKRISKRRIITDEEEKGDSTKFKIDLSGASTSKSLMHDVISTNQETLKESLDKDKCDMRYVHCNADGDDIINLIA